MAGQTIARLAAAAGVGVETVRYYQRRGLMAEPARDGGIRRYGEPALRRLRFIRAAKATGFSLEEIGELLDLDAVDDRARAHALAASRIAILDARIAEMQTARAALARLADACGGAQAGPCPILRAFEE